MRKLFLKKITKTNIRCFVEKHASDGYTLDLGCSGSKYANFFPNRIGLDIEDKTGVDVVGDAHDIPFADDAFDNILCTELLEHTHSPHVVVDEMHRVLKPGGKLILTTRFIYPLHGAPHDYFRFTKYGLQYLFRKWRIDELENETKTSLGGNSCFIANHGLSVESEGR